MEGKLARLLAGQDPDELAAKVRVHPETARRWLNSEALPYRKTLPAVANATGIAIADLRVAHRSDHAERRAAERAAREVAPQ